MILVAVSGGFDSVVLAWRLLTMDNRPIHLHHVHLHNGMARRTGRAEMEDRAIDQVIAWLHAHCRPFGYTSSRIDRDARADIVIVTEECAKLVTTGTIKRPEAFMRGAQAHDFARGVVGSRQAAAIAAWHRLLGPDAPPIEFPMREMTRAQMMIGVPEELIALTWSCRKPQTVQGRKVACRECRTCREMIEQGVPLERVEMADAV